MAKLVRDSSGYGESNGFYVFAAIMPTSSTCSQLFLKCSKLLLGVCLVLFTATLLIEDFAYADNTTYYMDAASGNDSNSGTSTTSPWRTINKANTLNFEPGDRLLFRGGQTFSGNLRLGAEDAGLATNPVNVGSYGSGRATISAGTGTGVRIYNAGGIEVSSLAVRGAGRTAGNTVSGVLIYTDRGGATKFAHIRVANVEVSGFGDAGVLLVAAPSDGTKSGFRDVRITDVSAHDNADAGIESYGRWSSTASGWAHEDVYIARCRTYNNLGIPNKGDHSGNGIVLGDVNGATIERSVAYNNGANNNAGSGPVGIWAWDSNRVTIQHNESYNNKTTTADGGGFDLDGGVTNSIMQYNYSHNNAGPGYLLAQFGGARPFSNNVVRYNISENDVRKGSYYGAIHFWNGDDSNGTSIKDTEVYHNTIYVSPQSGTAPKAVSIDGPTTNTHLRNNIFVTTGGVPLVDITSRSASQQRGLLFQGNDYWSSGYSFKIRHSGTTYLSLSAWRSATGQEKNGGTNTGMNVNPGLVNPGGGGTIGNADLLSTLGAYKLGTNSPMKDAALNLRSLFGLNPGPTDFYGTSIPQGASYDLGAHEASSP
jgi:hypothetical protein